MDDWQINALIERVQTLEEQLSEYARENEEQHRRSLRMHQAAKGWFNIVALLVVGIPSMTMLDKWLPEWLAGVLGMLIGMFAGAFVGYDFEKAEGDYNRIRFPFWFR